MNLNFLKDKDFLKALDSERNKTYLVKIEILDKDEIPIKAIEGRVQSGSVININGSSSVRRTCNLSIIADESENDLSNIDSLLSINKRIRILEGIKNNITTTYDDYVWFPLGIFVIIQPNITHNATGCLIQLSCKDKMCLLNGECAGGLPTAVVFSEYDQIIGLKECDGDPRLDADISPNNYTVYYDTQTKKYWMWTKEKGWDEKSSATSLIGQRTSVPQRLYDIIQTLVNNFGGIALSKIFINDVPLQIKQLVRYVGTKTLYYNYSTGKYTTNEDDKTKVDGVWRDFHYNDDVGYVYTDFVYPTSSTLVSSIGDNICSILDKIKNLLGNYEYFFDVEGNFVFQEKKNYLNNSYDPVDRYRLDYGRKVENLELGVEYNNLNILNDTNYKVDFYRNTKSAYTFTEGEGLIISFSNSPNFSNIKNDFHIWGEISDTNHPIHYHIAIKQKPLPSQFAMRQVIFLKDKDGKYNGKIRLATDDDKKQNSTEIKNYVPNDWRAELYLQGLEAKATQHRPDIYQQELLDLFDNIYAWGYYDDNLVFQTEGRFKADLVYNPNDLEYFFDFLDPADKLADCSVDKIGTKIYSYQEEKIRRLYNTDVPDQILFDINMDAYERIKLQQKCYLSGQSYANVDHSVYAQIAEGTNGYTAQEVARELLYQYTNYNEVISIQVVPIYYLDVNTRITVRDKRSGIYGDYIINSISLPLNAGSPMTINASKALERI